MHLPVEEPHEGGPGLLAAAWRYRWWIVLATLVAGSLGWFLSSLQPTTYEATARLFLADPRQGALFGTQRTVDPERYIPQQSERITSQPVLERAAAILPGDLLPGDIDARLEVQGDVELDLIEITASGADRVEAAELANAAATAYTQVAQASRLESAQEAAEELEQAAAELDEQIAELQSGEEAEEEAVADQVEVLIRQRVDITSRAQQQLVEARVFGSGIDLLEEATPPTSPASPSPRRDAILAAVLGGALAASIGYWRAGRVTSVVSRNQPSEILGVPLLGVLPLYRNSRDGTLEERLSIDAEAQESYEFLLSSLEYALAPLKAASVLVTSGEPGQGKTEIALQLSVTALLQGRRVILVDGDLRVRSLTDLVEADGGPGLVDLAVSSPRQYRTFLQTPAILGGEARLPVLPAGSTADEGAGSLRQAGVRRGLKVMSEESDLVIVDSAPMLATADTTTLSRSVDAMLLVIRAGTDIADLESLRERLSFVGCPTVGYVYVTADRSDIGYAYGYGAYRYRHTRTTKSEVVGMPAGAPSATDPPSWLREPVGGRDTAPPARPPLARRDDAGNERSHPLPEDGEEDGDQRRLPTPRTGGPDGGETAGEQPPVETRTPAPGDESVRAPDQ